MKKGLPILLGGLLIVALAALFYTERGKAKRQFNQRVSLRQRDKIPYGTFIAYRLLPELFPHSEVSLDKKFSLFEEDAFDGGKTRAVILVAKSFSADESEMEALVRFARKGNQVLILAQNLSYSVTEQLGCADGQRFFLNPDGKGDSLVLFLSKNLFPDNRPFYLPGTQVENHFNKLDSARTLILGTDDRGNANFIQMNAGPGRIFVHLAPLAFSNYFLLHKRNADYFRTALSVLPRTVNEVVWNEYFLYKPQVNKPEKGWLDKVMEYPGLRAGLLTAFGVLLLFALLGLRRRQRAIPLYHRPRNESLDFVKTIGRLYFDQSDHKNLARKMGAYFLDHVRTQFKLPTHSLDETFIHALQAKSGYDRAELLSIVQFIQFSETAPAISESQLIDFYRQLENYYQST